jgi:hypothetical protein
VAPAPREAAPAPPAARDQPSYLSLALWTLAFGLLGIAIGLAWRGSLEAALGSAWHTGAAKPPAPALGEGGLAHSPAAPAPSPSASSPPPPVVTAPATDPSTPP